MPPESLWVQYSIVGILLLTSTAIAGGFYRLWRELIAWIEREDAKRVAERNAQREWDAAQARIRDERWQAFFRQMQDEWMRRDERNNEVLEQLAERVGELTIRIDAHDSYVRARERRG